MDRMERIPPHNDEAEKSVLGAVLIDREVFFKVSEVIGSADFYKDAHKEIFEAMTELFRRSEPIDVVTLSECLKKRKSLEAVGGRSYIAELSTLVPTTANAVQYARIISEHSVRRQLISAGGSIVEESYSGALDSQDVLNNAEKTIFNIARNHQSSEYSDIQHVLGKNIERIQEAQKSGGKLPGLSTGYKELDRMTTGLQKSDMIIIAARPSMGKTALALNIAQNAALKSGARVVIFSLEMSKEQLGLRLLSMEARLDSKKLRLGDVSDEDWGSINDALNKFAHADIIIDDTPGIGIMEMRNKCRRITAEKPIDLIVVDYLQMMSADRQSESRQQDITMISRMLKQIAREMECPVVVLSQLSRAVEQRTGDHRPILSDLRESGAIEQDADVVMFLYRADYYKAPDAELNNICEVIIAKQRTGEIGSVDLTWIPRFTKFADIARTEPPRA
ncbi:MAG: replicative DNA helicase [Firmicutes bacterium]|nr:replicative DNA helicase [Bacillota bacterium]MBR6350971.1 replicative DNA helicase [Bacillota bacterium]